MTSPDSIRLAALTLALAHRRSIELQLSLLPSSSRVRRQRLTDEFNRTALEIGGLDPDGALRDSINSKRCEVIVG